MADVELLVRMQEWIRYAREDAVVAKHLFTIISEPQPHASICYHCQQAAEKYLKAVLEAHGESVPRTHDLASLNDKCTCIDSSFSKLNAHCIELSAFIATSRYPFVDMTKSHDRNDTLLEYEKMRAIEAHVIEHLNSLFQHDILAPNVCDTVVTADIAEND